MPKVTFAQIEPQLKCETFDVPEWGGGSFTLQQLDALKYENIMAEQEATKGSNTRLMARVLSATLTDEDGIHPTEEFLLKIPVALLNRLSNKANELNGINDKADQAIEKN